MKREKRKCWTPRKTNKKRKKKKRLKYDAEKVLVIKSKIEESKNARGIDGQRVAVGLFLGILTLLGYLMLKPPLQEDSNSLKLSQNVLV